MVIDIVSIFVLIKQMRDGSFNMVKHPELINIEIVVISDNNCRVVWCGKEDKKGR